MTKYVRFRYLKSAAPPPPLITWGLGITFQFAVVLSQVGLAAPVNLRTDGLVNPLGIDSPRPVLSWRSDNESPDWTQHSYRILVASSAARLHQGYADIWDSGRQLSSDSIDIPYGGPRLSSQQRCFWSVQTWGSNDDAETSSETAVWEMGLLEPSDWQAQWIRGERSTPVSLLSQTSWIGMANQDRLSESLTSETEFRLRVHFDELPESASLHIITNASFVAFVNGSVTGHKSTWASFDREEVLDDLRYGSGNRGDNVIVVRVSKTDSQAPGTSGPRVMAAALHVSNAGGPDRWVVSNKSWEARVVGPQDSDPWHKVQLLGSVHDRDLNAKLLPGTPRTPLRVDSSATLFRKDFILHKGVRSARLYITSLGSYVASINGARVGDAILTPGFTDYRKRLLYQTYDVGKKLKTGWNALGVELGPGWHGSPLLWTGVHLFPGPELFRAELEITFADRTRQTLVTDESWKTSYSPVISSEIYAGETYDSRREQQGWNSPLFHAHSRWHHAVNDRVNGDLRLTAEPDLPVHAQQTIRPRAVKLVPNSTTHTAVFDMGQNMVGLVRLQIAGPRGSRIRLRFAERLSPDGTIYTENLRGADATDEYILNGQGEQQWMPAFTFHGFRYVEISGTPTPPTLDTIEGVVLSSLQESPSIRIETSSNLLNQMIQLGLWGQRGNFLSIPTDCPQRDERMGWMGDAGAFWRTGAYQFDTHSFSHKFMLDVMDAQKPSGAFTDISPDLLTRSDDEVGAPGWGDAGILVPYATWLQYGDRSLIEQAWPGMERWMNFILRANPSYVRNSQLGANYGDWLAPDPRTPKDLVATAYWALLAQQMQAMAKALNRTADAQRYAVLFERIRAAFQSRYIQRDGTIKGNSQTSYVLTLYASLAPPSLKEEIVQSLVDDIRAHETHLTTGFLGTPYLLSALDTAGRTDLAYKLLLTSTYPSWGYMVEHGATTWWERWNGDSGDPSMNSYNHYAFGSVLAWVYERVAGIDADPFRPGFHHILVTPHFDAGLTHVHAEYDSVYGTITSEWTRSAAGTVTLSVRIPPNTTATVDLSLASEMKIEQDGATVQPSRGEDRFRHEVGSGLHTFRMTVP